VTSSADNIGAEGDGDSSDFAVVGWTRETGGEFWNEVSGESEGSLVPVCGGPLEGRFEGLKDEISLMFEGRTVVAVIKVNRWANKAYKNAELIVV
jgi:hypothetical protein